MGRLDWTEKSSAVIGQRRVISDDATKRASILMGFDPNSAILTSAIGRLFFLPATGGKVPS